MKTLLHEAEINIAFVRFNNRTVVWVSDDLLLKINDIYNSQRDTV